MSKSKKSAKPNKLVPFGKVTISLPPSLEREIKALAIREKRTFSNMIRVMVESGIALATNKPS